MGHPISSSGPTEQQQHLPMVFQQSKGGAILARASQHRPSRSISSLPLEKLSKINCESKRTSVSALNSPAASPGAAARSVLGETQERVMLKPQTTTTSIASILGQSDHSAIARRKGGRRRGGGDAPNSSGAESGCESDRKPSSFNLFRGHRRVGSGSNITHKTPTWDSSSPRTLKLSTNATTSTTTSATRSATASPKKLDKYAVAKIAASLFHSPVGMSTKLEHSQSQRASGSSPRRRVEKKRGTLQNHALVVAAGELIVPAGESHHPPTEESVPARSSLCSEQQIEDSNSAIPPASKTPSVPTHVNIDDSKPEEGEETPEGPSPPPPPLCSTPVEESPPPCITENTIPSADPAMILTLNSPVAAENLLEKFNPGSPEDTTVSAPPPFGGLMPADTDMETIIPDSPTVSIAALFEDHTAVVEDEDDDEEEAHVGVEEEEEGSTGAAAGDFNAFLQIEDSELLDRGDLGRGCQSGDIFGDAGQNSFPTSVCHVAMEETRKGDGGEELAAGENAIGDCQSTQVHLFPTENLPNEKEEEELTEASALCTTDGEIPAILTPPSPSRDSQPSSPPSPSPFPVEDDRHSPDRDLPMKSPSPSPPSEEEEELETFPRRGLPMLRVPLSSSSPRLMPGLMLLQQPPQSVEELAAAAGSSSCGNKGGQPVKVVHHVVKPTLRKRRRSASGSGLSAMLLKVVRVPEEGTIVTRRFVESPEWPGRQQNMVESSSGDGGSGSGLGREANGGSGVCESEPEDAVKSTYSKFVDIEIDPGHDCVELVQHSKDIYHDNTGGNIGWKRHPQAAFFERQFKNNPRRLPPVKINTCSVYEGKARARKSKTIRRGKMNSYDLETLKEYLKTANSVTSALAAQTDTTSETPKAPKTPKAVASPPPPAAAAQPKMDSILPTRERSRTFVSRLQAPSSRAFSYVDADVYRPCSVSILSNPSCSSSHQDKLWEEQAEIYSSGGRGTPGREDDDDDNDKVRAGDKAAAHHPPQTLLYNLHHHSPLPRFGSIHHQQLGEHPGYNQTMRQSALGSSSLRSPSESGHFMHQIMSKIRGSSPKRVSSATIVRAGSCPTSQLEIAKRRNPWSSCICFSVKS